MMKTKQLQPSIQEMVSLQVSFYQGGSGHWAIYNTSPQSFIIFSFSLAQQQL